MRENKHPEKNKRTLFLRDHLAAYRTILANERTFLAYIRTALTLFVAGVSFIKFFDSPVIEVLGWTLIPVGVFVFVRGVVSYRRMNRKIQQEEK